MMNIETDLAEFTKKMSNEVCKMYAFNIFPVMCRLIENKPEFMEGFLKILGENHRRVLIQKFSGMSHDKIVHYTMEHGFSTPCSISASCNIYRQCITLYADLLLTLSDHSIEQLPKYDQIFPQEKAWLEVHMLPIRLQREMIRVLKTWNPEVIAKNYSIRQLKSNNALRPFAVKKLCEICTICMCPIKGTELYFQMKGR